MSGARPAWRAAALTALTWVLVLLTTFPLLWMLLTSLKPQTELFALPPTFLPESISFAPYLRLLFDTPFPRYFANSIVLATVTTLLVVAIGAIGAHSLLRFSYRGREALATLVLATYLLPSVVLIVPLYLMMVEIGLANRLASLIIAYTSFALPYALWLLRSFMAAIPEEMEAAARVDGASRIGAFVDIILPQALPGIGATALFTFILAWNDYLYALVLVNTDTARPLTTGVVTMFVTTFNVEWSMLMAASVLMSIPPIILFTFFHHQLSRSIGAAGVRS